MPLLQLVTTYGYPCLIALVLLASAGVPLPVEALLIALGVLSAQGEGLPLLPLAGLALAGAVSGDLLDYWLGRFGSQAVRKWAFRALQKLRITGWETMKTGQHGWRGSWAMIFVTRFLLTWLGTPISILAGTTHVAFVTFLAWDVCGEAVYVVGNLALGRWASAWLDQGWFEPVFWGLVALVTALPALLALWRWFRKRRKPATLAELKEALSEIQADGDASEQESAPEVQPGPPKRGIHLPRC